MQNRALQVLLINNDVEQTDLLNACLTAEFYKLSVAQNGLQGLDMHLSNLRKNLLLATQTNFCEQLEVTVIC